MNPEIEILDENGNVVGQPLKIAKATLLTLESIEELILLLANKLAVIVKGEDLQYHLQLGGAVKTDNVWLDSASYNYNTNLFKFIFSTRLGKVSIYVGPKALINQYYADGLTLILDGNTFKVNTKMFAPFESAKIALTALLEIYATSDTPYLTLYVPEKGDANSLTVYALVLFGSFENNTDGFASVSAVKNHVNSLVTNLSCGFVQLSDTNYPDITHYYA